MFCLKQTSTAIFHDSVGCLGSSGWFLLRVSHVVTAKWLLGLKSSEGSNGLDIQDGFFDHKSGTLAGRAQTAGYWPGIFVFSFSTWLVWASSKHDGLVAVRLLIQMLASPRANIPKDQRQKLGFGLAKEASFLSCFTGYTETAQMNCRRWQEKGFNTGKQSTLGSCLLRQLLQYLITIYFTYCASLSTILYILEEKNMCTFSPPYSQHICTQYLLRKELTAALNKWYTSPYIYLICLFLTMGLSLLQTPTNLTFWKGTCL